MGDFLTSWGKYPSHAQTSHAIYWREELSAEVIKLAKRYEFTLPFGKGRSYGDSCLAMSDHVLHTISLNRFISFDKNSGVLIAESGVTLEQILSLVIPHGWFLPVTPGTKYVTLGGAIANDVHGKNHHVRGTFGKHVIRFGLVRSDGQSVTCALTENTELFAATIGGLGLTGVVDWVELQLLPIKSSNIDMSTIRFGSLNEFFELSNELDNNNEYSVAWVDCLAKGKSMGRGVYMVGNHSEVGELRVNVKSKLSVPFTFPFSAINRLTLPILNSGYYHLHKTSMKHSAVSYDPFFIHWMA